MLFVFIFNKDQNATFSLLTYLRLTQFSYTEKGNFPDDFIPLNEIRNFDTLILATFMTILCFWSSNIIFRLRYASFPMILWLEQNTQFLLGGFFAFCRYPMKKLTVPINTARFPWPVRIKIPKSLKIDLCKKFCDCDDILAQLLNWRQNINAHVAGELKTVTVCNV